MALPFNIFDTLPRDCWVNIDTAQLAENVRRLQALAGRPSLVAVKGNGYGHGYDHAARAFAKGGAHYLGVANYGEGYVLKHLGIPTKILILGGILPEEMKLAAAAGLEFFVFRPDHIAALREMPKGTSPIRVHIKVDTGMGRLGCFAEEAGKIAAELKAIPGVAIVGVATHISKAGDAAMVEAQQTKFDQALAAITALGVNPEVVHVSKSGTVYNTKLRYSMVRLGIVAYGVAPAVDGYQLPEGVAPALTWHARITSSKILPKGWGVSYGGSYFMPKDGRVGILPVGYVDGYRRIMNVNTVLVEGQERKILGSVNMDQCVVDLDGLPDITGKEVVLLGKQGDKEISVRELARRWDINTYSVYSNIATRVPRRVISG